VVVEDGDGYRLDHDRPQAIEKIRGFLGNVHTVMKAYAWVMSLGADGLRAVAETAVLNNNYLAAGLGKVRGVTLPWPANNKPRLDQVRYSWEKLHEETGVSTFDILVRMVDFGVQHYLPSHVPMLVPQPFTLEPGESLTIEELDRMIAIMAAISNEAYETPEIVKTAPHNAAIGHLDLSVPEDPACWAFTHRALVRKEPAWTAPDRVKREAHEGGY
jgi:glycine dehydrogenase subunit 2